MRIKNNILPNKFLIATFVIFVLAFLYQPTTMNLLHRWLKLDESISHGIIVIFIFLFLYYSRLKSISFQDRFNLFGLVFVFLSAFLWFVSSIASIDIIEQLALFFILISIHLTILDKTNFIKIAGPLIFILFALPVWDYLNSLLLTITSIAVLNLVKLAQINAYIEENSIMLPYGVLLIADGCSGLRYFVISLALASFVLLTSKISFGKSALIVFLAALLGLITNWIRIFIIILVAYETEMQSGLIRNHEYFGWFLFLLVLVPLSVITSKFPKYNLKTAKSEISNPAGLYLLILFLLAVPLISRFYMNEFDTARAESLGNILARNPELKIQKTNFDHTFKKSVAYNDEYNGIELDITTLMNWKADSDEKLVPYLNMDSYKKKWKLITEIPADATRHEGIKILLLQDKLTGINKLLTYQFNIGGYSTNDYWTAKLLQIYALIKKENFLTFSKIETLCKSASCDFEKDAFMEYSSEYYKNIKQKILRH